MHRKAFTLVEIMIVILIIGILLSIAVPNWLSSREHSRKQACFGNLRHINDAKEQFAMENRLDNGAVVQPSDLWPTYLKGALFPECPNGGTYTVGNVGTAANCSFHGTY